MARRALLTGWAAAERPAGITFASDTNPLAKPSRGLAWALIVAVIVIEE